MRRISLSKAHRALRFTASWLFLLAVLLPLPSFASERDFAIRYTANTNGDIYLIGNTAMTCNGGCTQQNGAGDNGTVTMVYTNGNGYSNTQQSSSATLNMPAGSSVLWAGLYWQADSNDANRGTVTLQTPAGASALSSTQIGSISGQGCGGNCPTIDRYGAFVDVTNLVQVGGNGTYTVTNIIGSPGNQNTYAGWGMVVVLKNDSLPFRNLTVYDGYRQVTTNTNNNPSPNPNIFIPVSGFLTPYSGPVNTVVGVIAGEGDRGNTGDNFYLNGTPLIDSYHVSNDFFSSYITDQGKLVTSKTPNYSNQLGWDVARINASNILPNGATSATINLNTGGDWYYASAVTFMTDVYVPIITPNVNKSAADVNGGYLLPGDTLRFTISLGNTGYDTATNVILTDNIPTWTTYVPNSLRILTGANAGAKTDAGGDDQAEYVSSGTPHVVFRLGQGAGATTGGSLPLNAFTSISFDVTVNADIPAATSINNTALISNNGQTISSTSYSSASNPVQVVVLTPPTVTKSFSPNPIDIGGVSTMTLQVSNPAGNAATITGVNFTDTYPAGMVNDTNANPTVSCTAGSTPGSLVGGVAGSGSIGINGATLAQNGSCTVTVRVKSTLNQQGNYTNSTGPVSTGNAGTSPGASATLSVGGPAISTSVSPPVLVYGSSTSAVTFTLANPTVVPLTGAAFTSSLPNGVQVVAGTQSNSCGGTVTAAAGGSSISLSGGTIPAAGGSPGTCSVTVPVTAVSGYYAISSYGVTTTQTPTAGAPSNTVNLTSLTPLTVTKSFSPSSIKAGADVSQLSVTVSNPNGTAAAGNATAPAASTTVSQVSLTDTYPAPYLVNTNIPNAAVSCSAGSSASISGGAAGGGSAGLTGGTLLPGGSCTLTVNVTGATAGNYTNHTGPVSFTPAGGSTVQSPEATAALNISALAPPTAAVSFTPSSMPVSQVSTLKIQLTNSNTSAISGVSFNDLYPGGLVTTASPLLSNTCGGTVTAAPGGTSLTLSGGTIPAASGGTPGSCTVSVQVQANSSGSYYDTVPQVTTTNAGVGAQTGATLYVLDPPLISKSFSPNSIRTGTGYYSTLNITVSNPSTNTAALTGVAFTDDYTKNVPTGLQNSGTATSSITCSTGSSGTLNGGANNGTYVGMTGGTILPGGNCVVSVRVTSATANNYVNTTSAVTSANGGTGSTASDILAVGNISIAKAFAASSIASGATTTMTITLTNGTESNINDAAFTDILPAGMSVTSFAAAQCTGTVTYNAATRTLALTGGDIARRGGTCQVQATVTATATATNTIPANAFTGGGRSNADPASATLAVYTPLAVTTSFSPQTVFAGSQSPSVLTIILSNPNDIAATGVSFTDNYPSGLINTVSPGVVNSCGGTVTANANGTSLSLTGGTINAGESCTVTVNVMSNSAGPYPNSTGTIATGNIGNQTTPATATLQVLQPLSVGTAFSPTTIGTGASSLVTVTLTNPNSGTNILGASFTDSLTSGLTIAAAPGGSTTCVGGNVSANGGDSSFSLSGATVPAGGSCTVSVNVTAASAGSYTSSTGPVNTSNAGIANGASAALTVSMPAPNLGITFSPAQIGLNGTSTMSVTISNPNSAAITNAGFTDSYPAGLVNAGTASVTCSSGTVFGSATTPDGSTLKLAGATVPAKGSCTVTVNVTSAAANGYTNTISAVTSDNAGTGGPASAPLLVLLNAPDVTASFTNPTIGVNDTSVLKIILTNRSSSPINGAGFTDLYPSGLVNGSTPGASISPAGCGGSIIANSGESSLSVANASIAANSSCTITVTVTSAAANTYSDSTGTVSSSNALPSPGATAQLVVSGTTLKKYFDGAASSNVIAGQPSTLKLTVSNGAGNPAQSGFSLTDTLPASLTIASTPAPSSSCGAVTTGINGAGRSYLRLASGTLAANQTGCQITATVSGTTTGSYRNYYDSNPANSTLAVGGGLNAAGADATLNIADAPTLTSGTFTQPTIVAGQTATITYTIHNNAAGSPTLTGLSYTDKLPGNLTFSTAPDVKNCGGATVVYSAPDTLSFTVGSVGSLDCTVTATVTSSVPGPYTNGTVTAGGGLVNNVASQSLTVIAPATLGKGFAPPEIDAFKTSVLTFTISNPAGNPAQSGLGFTDTLPGNGNLVLSSTPGFTSTCGGTITKVDGTNVSGGEAAFIISGLSIGAGGGSSATTCQVSVNVTSSVPGNYLNDTTSVGNYKGGLTPVSNMGATLTVQVPNPALTKSFTVSPILTGQTSTLKFTITNGQGNLQQSGLGFTDKLPAGMVVANPPNVTFSPAGSCGGSVYRTGTITDIAAGDTSLTLSGGSMTNGTVKCFITVDVTSATASTGSGYLNSTANGNVTDAAGNLDISGAAATLVVNNHATLSKAFGSPVMAAGTGTTLTFTVTNGAGSPAQSGLSFTDTFSSSNLVVTGAATPQCGGDVSFTANSVTWSKGVLNAGPPGPPNSCTVTANVNSTVPAPYSNGSAQIGNLGGGLLNGVTPQSLTVAADPILTTDAISAPVIGYGQQATLVFRIHNADPAQPTITGLGFTNKLPAYLSFTGSPAFSSSCGSTGVSAGYNTALDTLTFSGGQLGTTDCTITTKVTSTQVGGPYTNSSTNVTSVSGGLVNQVGAGTGVTVVAPTLTKAFGAATIGLNQTTSVTFTITNGSGNPAQSGFGFTETLPSGLTFVAGSQSTTCSAGTAALSGNDTLNFTGGGLNAGTPNSCTVSATVTSTKLGSYVNAPTQVAVGGGLANGIDPSTPPTLKVVGTSLTKQFSPATITAGTSSTLTFTIKNDASNPPQGGLAFTDNFPGGVVVATPVVVTNSCGGGLYKSGTTTALSGGESAVSFSGGSFDGGTKPSSCTVSVAVTSATTGGVNNWANITVPPGSPIDAGGASDTLTVNPAPKLDVTFSPNTIVSGGTSTLKFTIANGQGLPAQSGIAFTNQFPGTLVVADPSTLSISGTNCNGGAVYKGGTTTALSAGDNSLTLTGLSMDKGTANCFVSIQVTSSQAGSYNDNASRFSSLGGGLLFDTGDSLAVVTSNPTLTKAFGPSTIGVGDTSTLTFTINNAYVSSDYPAQSGLGFTDTLPANVVIASAPVTPQCGGAVAGTVGSNVITFSGGSLGVHIANCRIDVPVKSSVASTSSGYRNYYDGTAGAGKVTGLAGGLTATTADASLVVSGTTLSPSFAQSSAGLNLPVTLTFTITNGTNQPNQTGLGFVEKLPAGLALSGSPTTPQCGGTVAYSVDGSGRSVVTFSGGSLSLSSSGCTIDVKVTGATATDYTVDTSTVTSLSTGMTSSGSAKLTLLNPPTAGVTFGTSPIGSGGVSNMAITLTNPNSTDITGVAFSDTFPNSPGQMLVAATSNLNNGCGGSAAAGSNTLTLSNAVIPHNSSCTVSLDVTATTGGAYTDNTGAVTTANAGSGASAAGTLNVSAPTLTKAFGASSLVAGKTTSLTFTIANGAGNPPQKGMAFTDTMPANITVTGAASSQCGGTVSFTPGGISLAGGQLPSGPPGTCQVSATVTSAVAGTWTNGASNIGGLSPGLINGVTDQNLEVYLLPAITSTKAASATTGVTGDIIEFTSVVTNAGSGPATNVILTGKISPYIAFALNSYGAGVPFFFKEGTPASAVKVGSYLFSSDNGAKWDYTPNSGAGGAPAGYDGNITNWQIIMNGTMNPAGSNFLLSYKGIIK